MTQRITNIYNYIGKEGTEWEGGLFKVTMDFTNNYPADPPACRFEPVIFHPNVFNNGGICLSLLKKPENNYLGGLSNCWSAALSLKQIAMAIQELLHNPSTTHAAQVFYHITIIIITIIIIMIIIKLNQREAFDMHRNNPQLYKQKIREQAKKFKGEEE